MGKIIRAWKNDEQLHKRDVSESEELMGSHEMQRAREKAEGAQCYESQHRRAEERRQWTMRILRGEAWTLSLRNCLGPDDFHRA